MSIILEPYNGATTVTWAVEWALTGGFSLNALLRFSGNGAFEEMMRGSLAKLKQVVEQEAAALA